jgi:Flp pilus assembly protein TadG
MNNPLQSSESGNALIELAITLPLFALIILGGAEIANIAWSSVQINNAARAGAAFGSLSRANAADVTDIANAAQNEAPKLITTPSTQVTSTQACYCVSGGTSTSIPCDTNALFACPPATGTIQVAVQVSVQAPVTPLVHYPGLPSLYTVSARATMGVEQ